MGDQLKLRSKTGASLVYARLRVLDEGDQRKPRTGVERQGKEPTFNRSRS